MKTYQTDLQRLKNKMNDFTRDNGVISLLQIYNSYSQSHTTAVHTFH